jgi:hypothetical protein
VADKPSEQGAWRGAAGDCVPEREGTGGEIQTDGMHEGAPRENGASLAPRKRNSRAFPGSQEREGNLHRERQAGEQ